MGRVTPPQRRALDCAPDDGLERAETHKQSPWLTRMGDTMNTSDLREPELTADQFAIAQRELGLSDRELASNLGLSPRNGDVTIRRIKHDQIPCSGPIACAMVAFLQGFRPAWYRGPETK